MGKSQLPSRDNQTFCQNPQVLGLINSAIHIKYCLWSTGSKMSQKHQWPITIFDIMRSFFLYALVFCCQTYQWCVWSKGSISVSSSHTSNDACKLKICLLCFCLLALFIVLTKGCLCATLPRSLLVWSYHFIIFLDLVTQKWNQVRLFLNPLVNVWWSVIWLIPC